MARQLIELRSKNNNFIKIAVDIPQSDIAPVARSTENMVQRVDRSFDSLKDLITSTSLTLSEAFETINTDGKVKSAEAEFGISFNLKGDIFIVEASGEASLKVKVTWSLE